MDVEFTLDINDMIFDMGGSRRVHNEIAKSAMSEELVKHHQERIPRHFERSAHGRYGYMPRHAGYNIWKAKKYKRVIDLVKTGQSQQMITRVRQVVVKGDMTRTGTITGELRMKFPFPGSADDARQGVTMEQMKREITSTTAEERNEIKEGYVRRYRDKLEQYRASGRMQRFYRSH